jgi:hypothetical protein
MLTTAGSGKIAVDCYLLYSKAHKGLFTKPESEHTVHPARSPTAMAAAQNF